MLIRLEPTNPREWQATVGLDSERFMKLVDLASSAFTELNGKSFEKKILDSPNLSNIKIRSVRELIFFTLFILKSGITFDIAGFLMEFDQSRAHRNFGVGLRLIHYTLDVEGYIPVRSIADPLEFNQVLEAGSELIIDATEQYIQRPQDRDVQKEAYSGKKKHHTCKAMIISTLDRYIHYVSNSYTGNSHDFSLLKYEFDPSLDWFEGYTVRVDLGYQGFLKDYPKATTHIPIKKPKGGELTEEQKAGNKKLAAERIYVEHSIGGIKRYDILSGVSRISRY